MPKNFTFRAVPYPFHLPYVSLNSSMSLYVLSRIPIWGAASKSVQFLRYDSQSAYTEPQPQAPGPSPSPSPRTCQLQSLLQISACSELVAARQVPHDEDQEEGRLGARPRPAGWNRRGQRMGANKSVGLVSPTETCRDVCHSRLVSTK